MRPGQKARRCVAFSKIGKGQVELAEILEGGDGYAASELIAERLRKVSDEKAAIVGSIPALLFLFDDAPTYVPIGFDHELVRGRVGTVARGAKDRSDILGQAR